MRSVSRRGGSVDPPSRSSGPPAAMSRTIISVVMIGAIALAGARATARQATAPQPSPPATSADAIAHGTAVFGKLCAGCHGGGGVGGRAPSLVDSRKLRAMSNQELEMIIRTGTSNGMPGFGSAMSVMSRASCVRSARLTRAPERQAMRRRARRSSSGTGDVARVTLPLDAARQADPISPTSGGR
jgi:mono/diheme cytochrome c family protein